jgi:MFS family permease
MLIESLSTRDAISPSQSLHALDWLNLFVAALLMGFGPIVAVHLTGHGWGPADIGFVLTIGGLAGLLTQVPAGDLIDMTRSKRALIGAGILALALGLLIIALRPDVSSVFLAVVIQGAAGSVLGPGIAAISLGLVGNDALPERLGRNQRFASVGALAAAAIIGAIGYLLSTQATFFVSAALALPIVLALIRIRAGDIDFCRSCGASNESSDEPARASRIVLFKDSRLLTFAICLFLFQLANASILPLIAERLVHAVGPWSTPMTSALTVVSQIVVAAAAPWVGRTAASWGRRPLLLIGLGAVPLRAALFALTADPALLVAIQVLDGVSGATLGVLTALVIADLTKGIGRFNLAQGLVGAISGVGASLSTSMSGLIVERFGDMAGFLAVTAVGLLAVAILFAFMPETKPSPGRPSLQLTRLPSPSER